MRYLCIAVCTAVLGAVGLAGLLVKRIREDW